MKNKLLICRQVPGRLGFGLEEFDARYSSQAKPIFSELDLETADDSKTSEVLDFLADITGTAAGGAQTFDTGAWKGASIGLVAVSGIFAVTSFAVRNLLQPSFDHSSLFPLLTKEPINSVLGIQK